MAKRDYCVIGLGRFGAEVATQLDNSGKKLLLLDINMDLVQKYSKIYDVVIQCDASDYNSLKETGVNEVRTTIVGIGDIEANIMVCSNLIKLGVKDIIAIANNLVHKRILKTMGVGRVVVPQIEIAQRVAFQSLFNTDIDIASFATKHSWVRVVVSNKDVINKTLVSLDLRRKYGTTVLIIQRQQTTIFPPSNDTRFELGDVVTFMCHDSLINKVLKIFVSEHIEKNG